MPCAGREQEKKTRNVLCNCMGARGNCQTASVSVWHKEPLTYLKVSIISLNRGYSWQLEKLWLLDSTAIVSVDDSLINERIGCTALQLMNGWFLAG